MADTPELQNINFQVSGAEKVVGLTSALQDFSGVLQQLMTNPLSSGYAMRRVHDILTNTFVEPLKKGVELTKAQQIEFDKLTARGRNIATLTGAVAGLGLAMVETMRQTRVASAELGRFFNLQNLPGGAKNLYTAQLNLQEKSLDKAMKYNEAFAKDYEQLYKELARKMTADMPKDERGKALFSTDQVEELYEQLTLLSQGTGVSAIDFIKRLRDNFKNLGIAGFDAAKMYKLFSGEVLQNTRLMGYDTGEFFNDFFSSLQEFQRADIEAPDAIDQILTMMETYSDQLGTDQLRTFLSIIPHFRSDLQKSVLGANMLGITPDQLRGPAGGVNLMEALRKFVQGGAGGEKIKDLVQLFWKSPQTKVMLESMGLTQQGLIQELNNLKAIDRVSTDIADKWRQMKINPSFLENTENTAKSLQSINDALYMSQSLWEILSTSKSWLITKGQQGLGSAIGTKVPAFIPEAILTAIMAGITWKAGPKVARHFLKDLPKLTGFGAGLGAEVGTGIKLYDASGKLIDLGAELTEVGKYSGAFSKFTKGLGKISGFLTLAIAAYEVIDEINKGVDQNLTTGEIISNIMDRQLSSFTFGLLERSPVAKPFSYSGLLMPSSQTPQPYTQEVQDYVTVLERQQQEFDQKALQQNRESLEQGLGKGYQERYGGVAPADFLSQERTAVNMANLQMASTLLPKEEEPKEGEGKDFGTLNVIFSNDKGDILAQTSIDNRMKQTAIRIALSSEIGLG